MTKVKKYPRIVLMGMEEVSMCEKCPDDKCRLDKGKKHKKQLKYCMPIYKKDPEKFVRFRPTVVLMPYLRDSGKMVVSESGVRNADDVHFLMELGVDALLVGTSIMRGELKP